MSTRPGSSDPLRIRTLSREPSSSSLGGYHRASPASIPFLWESEPGTPKHTHFHHPPLPPLTPPPSYHHCSANGRRSCSTKPAAGSLMTAIFPRSSSAKKSRTPPSSSSSSSPSSSSRSTPSSPATKAFHRRGRSRQIDIMSFDSRGEEEEGDDDEVGYGGSLRSAVCFRVESGSRVRASRGCCTAMVIKLLKR